MVFKYLLANKKESSYDINDILYIDDKFINCKLTDKIDASETKQRLSHEKKEINKDLERNIWYHQMSTTEDYEIYYNESRKKILVKLATYKKSNETK